MEQRNETRRQTGGENHAFLRDIYHAFSEELVGVAELVYGAILMAEPFPAVARLLDEIARVELAHYEQLGQLLLSLGIHPTPGTRLRATTLRQSALSQSELPLTARKILTTTLEKEEAAAKKYKSLAANAPQGARALLQGIAAEKEGHTVALGGMLERLSRA